MDFATREEEEEGWICIGSTSDGREATTCIWDCLAGKFEAVFWRKFEHGLSLMALLEDEVCVA